MRFRAVLSVAASAAAALAFATPANAEGGAFLIRDARSGRCLTVEHGREGALGECSPAAAWRVIRRGGDEFQIAEVRGEDRCLRLAPVPIFPPFTDVARCGEGRDLWQIRRAHEGFVITSAHTDLNLTPRGDRVVAEPGSPAEWHLQPVD
ncbi:hypothetical protein OG204_27245 [Streptomyces sp. NBC_01387]|uniref:RICIN domain-containing protein n=1 Tax=unclassified Streptomyces TaxID=2593676 RepID=UPI002024F9D1|nr:hypothetical protein [Streptomyces sp. A 4/2]